MTAKDVKVLVGESDSTEFDDPREYRLVIDDLVYGETGDSEKLTENSAGDITVAEYFNGATQITANRKARCDITYANGLPTTEVWKIYSVADGTTVRRTVTLTYTWTGQTLTNTVETVT